MKKLIALASIVAVIMISLSFVKEDPTPGFKNLKVLPKNTTHDQMDSIMKHFAKSLGVKCNYCHVRTEDGKHLDFPNDGEPHKNVARSMLKMTAKINKKYFGHGAPSVTCFSCHNGKEEPALFPAKDKDDE
ncbi:MAG: c-type cytochrome [Flavitalea sp.]